MLQDLFANPTLAADKRHSQACTMRAIHARPSGGLAWVR